MSGVSATERMTTATWLGTNCLREQYHCGFMSIWTIKLLLSRIANRLTHAPSLQIGTNEGTHDK